MTLLSTMLFILIFARFFICYCTADPVVNDGNKTIAYHVTATRESLDLTISHHVFPVTCTHQFLTLIDLISFYSSSTSYNRTISPENITTLKLIHLCVSIDIISIQKLLSIRRLIVENCTIHFIASHRREDYDLYPKNLSRWSFNQGQTDTFNQFISMINYIGPFKFDLHFSNCFKSVSSFNDFIPLDTPLIFLNITCNYFQIDEPSYSKTRTAIFLTPTLMIDTQFSVCPSIDKYRWLNLKRTHIKLSSLRTLTCENRLIELNFEMNETITMNTIRSQIINSTMSIQSPNSNRWTTPILINFGVILLSILILSLALTMFLIRFCKK